MNLLTGIIIIIYGVKGLIKHLDERNIGWYLLNAFVALTGVYLFIWGGIQLFQHFPITITIG